MRLSTAAAAIAAISALLTPAAAQAENGARLFGFGTVSRSMGGVGVAAPQEAIGALTSNPASLSFRPRAAEPELSIAGTLALAKTEGEVNLGGQSFEGSAELGVPIFNLGLVLPVSDGDAPVLMGFSLFAQGGFGVDYRDEEIDQPDFYNLGPAGSAPLIVGEYGRFQALAFGQAFAFQPHERVSVGIEGIVTAAALDVGQGTSSGYGFGVQVGVSARPHDLVILGASYSTRQRLNFHNVADLDRDGKADDLDFELPHVAQAGVAFEPIAEALLFEVNVRWLGWAHADGFEDADWRDQWVVAAGVQGKPIASLALRAGYNYGRSPVERHALFTGTDVTVDEGAAAPVYYGETGRTIGNPAIAEHHFTAGFGYEVSSRLTLDLGVAYTPGNTLREQGTDILGQPVSLRTAGLYAVTVEWGLTLRF